MKSKTFIHDDFLLQTETARRLYHEFAKAAPISDFHCHLSPADIATNRRFNNLFEIWLEGDHYKWRAMRANGVVERFCTGDATPLEKFKAWAATVPHTLRNPLYHWTHLELARYFGITELLNTDSANAIWNQANELLASDDLTTQGILRKFDVRTVCTTDDPTDDLKHHRTIASSKLKTRVFPTWRPDKALAVGQPELFNGWVAKLETQSGVSISNLNHFLEALDKRVDNFHANGCRLSDHGLNQCPADFCSETVAGAIFDNARAGRTVSAEEQRQFATFILAHLGERYAEHGWTMQMHLGALRNNNTRLLGALGPDTGFDSIGDFPQGRALSAFLDHLDSRNKLPKTILYNVNPTDNYLFGTMIGNFQDGTVAGKIQLGSGWWFLDQKEGMECQMNALSNLGLLSRFVGMVTDSRSFMSYPRHEYFRRVLCNLIGRDIENGEVPNDDSLVGPMIRNICFCNAHHYLQLGENVS
ncbi:glucuronate isomerase [bacterium]|nr:glucuronate isomerase [bacterium]